MECVPGVIRSAARMTYTDVHKVIESDPETTARYAHLAENFRTMRDLALVLNARRRKLGSIDFDLPERVIEFDPEGRMTNIVRSERNIAHRLIEEFMLCANQAVARYLEKRGLGFLHRVHEKPDAKKVFEFEELAHAFGYSLGIEGLAEKTMQVRHGGGVPKRRDGRANRGSREQPMFVSVPGRWKLNIRPAALSAAHRKNCGQAGGTDHFLLDVAFAEASALCGRTAGTFRAGVSRVCALHFADPPLSGPNRAPRLKWALAHPPGTVRQGYGATVQQNRTRRDGAGNIGRRAPFGGRRTRTDGLEDGAIHGEPARATNTTL